MQLDLNLRCIANLAIQMIFPILRGILCSSMHPEQVLGNIYLSDACVIVDLLAIPNAFYTQELDHLHVFRLTCFCLDCVCMSHCYPFDVCKLEIFSVCLFHIYHRHTPYMLHMFVKMYHEIVSTPALESYAWVKIPALLFLEV